MRQDIKVVGILCPDREGYISSDQRLSKAATGQSLTVPLFWAGESANNAPGRSMAGNLFKQASVAFAKCDFLAGLTF